MPVLKALFKNYANEDTRASEGSRTSVARRWEVTGRHCKTRVPNALYVSSDDSEKPNHPLGPQNNNVQL